MKVSQFLINLFFGFIYVLVWAECGISINNYVKLDLIFGFFYTLYAYYFILELVPKLNPKIVCILPILYTLAFLFIARNEHYFYLNPLIPYGVILYYSIVKVNSINKISYHFWAWSFIFFYIFIHDIWYENAYLGSEVNDQIEEDLKPLNHEGTFNIEKLNLTTDNGDTLRVETRKPSKIVIMTTSQNCPPCVIAKTELAEFWNNSRDSFNTFFVDVSNPLKTNKKIENAHFDGTLYLNDLNSRIKNNLGFELTPTFLLFDQKGNLVKSLEGYSRGNPSIITKDFLE